MDATNLFAEERKAKIVEYIEKKKKATVQQLCEYFGVSSSTVRNDLRELERNNRLIRTHGGALVKMQTRYEVDINHRTTKPDELRRIAREAIKLIEDGDSIILDTGNTTRELARILSQRRGITVVTNDLSIATVLEQFDTVDVLVMGGMLRRHYHCTVGEAGKLMLGGLAVDKAFMGANSLTPAFGAATPDLGTAEIKRAMIAVATKVIVLCDSDKFKRTSFAQFASPQEIDTIITDAIDEEDRVLFEEAEVEVIVAPS